MWKYPEGIFGSTWTWTISVHEDWYDYYRRLPRTTNRSDYITPYDYNIKRFAESLKDEAEKQGYSDALYVISFVQNLLYVGDEYTGFDEYSKYPIEMLIDENGDCEDSSYLAASLLRAIGYGVVLINPPGHMMVGVLCSNCDGSYYEYNGRKYYILETTTPGWKIGQMPEGYSEAEIIPLLPYNQITSPTTVQPSRCTFPTGIACKDYMVDKSENNMRLFFSNNQGKPIAITQITANGIDGNGIDCVDNTKKQIEDGVVFEAILDCGSIPLASSVDTKYKWEIRITWYYSDTGAGYTKSVEGELYTNIEP
ncbi:MAG: hypothetical protein ABIG95_04015 [Candidatus Woesearchaeota archaeon]